MAAANEALAGSTDKLRFAFANQIKGNRAWIMMNRLFVGSPFWKISNKIKGINDGFVLMYNAQKKAIERQKELTKVSEDFVKISEKIPETGLFKRDGSALTGLEEKKAALEIMEGKEFQDRLALNQRLKQGGASLGGLSAMEATKKQFDDMIKIQQDQLDSQIEAYVKEEKYKEQGFMGKIARQYDNIKKAFRALPGFLFKGLMVFGKLLFGFGLLILLAPLLFKILRWGVGYVRNLTPEQRQKFANARDRIVTILGGVKELMIAIFEGKPIEAFKIYLTKVLVPIGKGIMALLKVVGEFTLKKFVELKDYIVSGGLAEDIGLAIDKYLGEKSAGVKKRLNQLDKLAQMSPLYGGIRAYQGSHFLQRMAAGQNTNTFASGGVMANSGMAIVGEGGPELVSLPRGARVHSNFASRGMGGTVINVNVTGRVGASDMEIRDIANKVAREINTQVNRTSSSTVRFA